MPLPSTSASAIEVQVNDIGAKHVNLRSSLVVSNLITAVQDKFNLDGKFRQLLPQLFCDLRIEMELFAKLVQPGLNRRVDLLPRHAFHDVRVVFREVGACEPDIGDQLVGPSLDHELHHVLALQRLHPEAEQRLLRPALLVRLVGRAPADQFLRVLRRAEQGAERVLARRRAPAGEDAEP